MNKEYAYLSNEEIIVTNEKGKMSKKKIESKDIEKELILENYIEKIDKIIDCIQFNLKSEQKNYPKTKIKKVLYNLLFFVPPIILTFAFMSIVNSSLIHPLLLYCLSSAVFALMMPEYSPIYIRKTKKRIDALQKELEKSEELKKKYENELIKLKSKVYQEEKEQDKSITQLGEIISLENYMDIPDEIYDEINEAYDQGYGKKLKLK